MGWLNLSPNDSCCRDTGHKTPALGWSNWCPNDSCCREAGHTTPTTAWLKLSPNDSSCREAGQTIPTTVWLKQPPNVILWRWSGHRTASTATNEEVVSITRCWSPFGHATDWRLTPDRAPWRCTNSDNTHSSIAALSTRTSIGSAHVKRRARTAGMRLAKRAFELLIFDRALWGRDHKLRGAWSSTLTCKVGTLLQAKPKSSDTSCSSSVDVYHRFFPPPHAWFKATMSASRHGFFPATDVVPAGDRKQR